VRRRTAAFALVLTTLTTFLLMPDRADASAHATKRADAAAAALMEMYDSDTGLWPSTGWWNAANAVTALLDHSAQTGSRAYLDEVDVTFEKNEQDDFTNEYMDDTGWWGLAWVRAYDVTGDRKYLEMAQRDADYMYSFRDDHCGGGIWWRSDKTYKNAITNELFVKLSASLHNRIPGDTVYLERAAEVWDWFEASGMINDDHLVNDGLDDETCANNGGVTWTYNQGVILGGLVEVSRATGDASLLRRATQIADAATSSASLNPGGVLTEPCEADDCGADGPSFKGIFVRNLGELERALPGTRFRGYLMTQARTAYANDRDDHDRYGLHWAGPFDTADGARQQSALDLMVATAARPPTTSSASRVAARGSS